MAWILKPKSKAHLSEILAAETGKRQVSKFDLSALTGIERHSPEDLTAIVAAGTTVKAMQQALARHQQWLPIDPPRSEEMTVGELIAGNWSGPHRFGFGTIRDYLIGIKVILADGTESNSGGQVVKNVAGFDLPRLFVGSEGSLGVIVEAIFKLGPIPEARSLLSVEVDSGNEVGQLGQKILEHRLCPMILDAHCVDRQGARRAKPLVVVGFAGSSEDVKGQEERLSEILTTKPSKMDYSNWFWQAHPQARRRSVRPSELGALLDGLSTEAWVARLGNGVVYHGEESVTSPRVPSDLELKLKAQFDPQGILPAIPHT
jgi:FAD/FMN-containing dehydrogenase